MRVTLKSQGYTVTGEDPGSSEVFALYLAEIKG